MSRIVLVCCHPPHAPPPPPGKKMDRQSDSRSVLSCSVTSSTSRGVGNVTVTKTIKTVTVIRRRVIQTTAAVDPVVFRVTPGPHASSTFRHAPYVRSRHSDWLVSDGRHRTTTTTTERTVSHWIHSDQRIRIPEPVTGSRQRPVPFPPLPDIASHTSHRNWLSHWNRNATPANKEPVTESRQRPVPAPLPPHTVNHSDRAHWPSHFCKIPELANKKAAADTRQRPVPVAPLPDMATHTGHASRWTWQPVTWNRMPKPANKEPAAELRQRSVPQPSHSVALTDHEIRPMTGQTIHNYKQTGAKKQECGWWGQK